VNRIKETKVTILLKTAKIYLIFCDLLALKWKMLTQNKPILVCKTSPKIPPYFKKFNPNTRQKIKQFIKFC